VQRIADGNHRRFCAILSAEIDPDFASAFTYTQIHRVPDCVVFAVDARFWVVSDPTDPARMALDAMNGIAQHLQIAHRRCVVLVCGSAMNFGLRCVALVQEKES